MTAPTIKRCLDKFFALCGKAGFVHPDNGPAFVSGDFKKYLLRRGTESSSSSIYHPTGNGQAEKTVGTVWKAVYFLKSPCKTTNCLNRAGKLFWRICCIRCGRYYALLQTLPLMNVSVTSSAGLVRANPCRRG